jgi:hypothetical protein
MVNLVMVYATYYENIIVKIETKKVTYGVNV